MKISAELLKRILQLRQYQDQHALGLGVARASYLAERAKLLPNGTVTQEELFKLGALEVEYKRKEDFWLGKIRSTEEIQRQVGEAALRLCGLDPAGDEYTIADGGQVQMLRAGQWVPFL